MVEPKITIWFLKMNFPKSLFAMSHLLAPLVRFVKIFTNNKTLPN